MPTRDCPRRDELLAYSSGVLSEEVAGAVIGHLSECPACQEALQALAASDESLMARLRRPATPDPHLEEPQCREAVARLKATAGRFSSTDVEPPGPPATEPMFLGELGEYRLLRKLGEGGMGTVYKAVHARLDRTVAIKVLPKDRMKSEQAIARFQHEMKAVGQLVHPHIVQATDAGEAGGVLFLVMEFIDGVDLSELVRRSGPLQIANACRLICEAAIGLEYAHQRGLIHRDVKPSNLMLSCEGRTKILDFGLALLTVEQPTGEERTPTGQIIGTADFMAPEQATDSHAVDVRADVYSLGCTLYKLLTGFAPFSNGKHRSSLSKMLAHVQEPVPSVKRCRGDVPDELAAILDRMLAKDPADRFATPAEVAEALSPFAANADLHALIARALGRSVPRAKPPEAAGSTEELHLLSQADTRSAHPSEPPPGARVAGRFAVWEVAAGLTLFAVVATVAVVVTALLVGAKGGREVVVRTPDGDTIRLDADGQLAVSLAPRAPMSPMALVTDPVPIAGVESWTVETRGHRGEVLTLAYSADGKLLATGCEDGTIRLWDLDTGDLVRALVGHGGPVLSIAWSPDSGRLISGSKDNTIRLWDAVSGRQLQVFRGSGDVVRTATVGWSPNGQYVAAGRWGNTIHVWDASSGELVQAIHEHTDEVQRVAWSPDSKTLAAASHDRTVRFWDAETGSLRRTLDALPGPVTDVAWSPDGKTVATACIPAEGRPDSIQVWDCESCECRLSLPGHLYGSRCVAWSPDGKTLAAAGGVQDDKLRAWNAETGQPVYEEDPGAGPQRAAAIAFSADGKQLAVARQEGTVEIRRADSGRTLRVLPKAEASMDVSADGHWRGPAGTEGSLVYIVLTKDGQETLTADEFRRRHDPKHELVPAPQTAAVTTTSQPQDRATALPASPADASDSISTARIGLAPTLLATLTGHTAGVTSLILLPDGNTLASGSKDQTIKLWDMGTGQVRATLKGHSRSVYVLALSPDGKTLASTGSDKTIKLWGLATRAEQRTIKGHTGNVLSLAFSPDGKTLASGSYDNTIKLWDLETGQARRSIVLTGPRPTECACSLVFFPDGKTLAAGVADWTVKLFDPETGQQKATFEGHTGDVLSIALAPDSSTLASSSRDGTVRLWDVATGRQLRSLPENTHDQASVAFSPDGKRLASAGRFGKIQLWEVKTGQLLATLEGHVSGVNSVVFSADGRTLASGSYDDTIKLWDLTPPPAVAPFDAPDAHRYQQLWADYLGVPVEMTNATGMQLVLIPPGEFDMGSSDAEITALLQASGRDPALADGFAAEGPQHRVKVTHPFYLGKHEVTREQYEQVMREAPSTFSGNRDLPVESVSWQAAIEFCRALSALSQEDQAGRVYRMPSEAEWEYACRAGTTTTFHLGDTLSASAANFGGNLGRTLPVDSYQPNALGLYGMHGSVREWCADWYADGYYSESPENDPRGPAVGTARVVRGGGWSDAPRLCRSACRGSHPPLESGSDLGFRAVCDLGALERRSRADDAALGGPIDLLKLVDPDRDAQSGSWRLDGDALVGDGQGPVVSRLPYQPPREYGLEMRVTRVRSMD